VWELKEHTMENLLADGAQSLRTLEYKILSYGSDREGGFGGVLRSAMGAEFAQPTTLLARTDSVCVLTGTDDALLDYCCFQTDTELDELEPMISGDVRAIQNFKELAHKAEEKVRWIYTYRALLRTVDTESPARKQDPLEQYKETRRVIEPVVLYLRELMEFTNRLCAVVAREVEELLKQRKIEQWWNEDRLWALVALLDQLLILDALKDPKSAIINDFAAWKRAVTALSAKEKTADVQHALSLVMDQDLYAFVSNKSAVMKSLLERLATVRTAYPLKEHVQLSE
jgi:hypothetical protein